jgi:RimJ/RimL family protein N-acetyltransferase
MSAIIKPRLAHVGEAAAVHAVLWATRDDIPITATDFNSEHWSGYVTSAIKNFFWVIEIDSTIAGVMLLQYQRRGVATALLACATKRHRSLTAKTKPDNNRTIKLLEREGFQFDSEDDWRHFAWRPPSA